MKIVIDINDNEYLGIKNHPDNITSYPVTIHLYEAVRKGIPLPKGHGDLKDIGQCDRKLFYQQCGGADSLISAKTAFDMLLSLPTIIKADKAESEG